MSTLLELKTALADALTRVNSLDRAYHDGVMTSSEGTELVELSQIVPRLQKRIENEERDLAVKSIGRTGPWSAEVGPTGTDLASAILAAGWDRSLRTSVTVDQSAALRFKTGSVDGGVDGTEVVGRFTAAPLGVDERYLFPHLQTIAVEADATGVQSYRQKARTLASPTDMLRAIDATSPDKPDTDTTAEVVNEPLKQIATISSGTPNVLLANAGFRGWVNNDLLAAFRAALDYHVVSELVAAGLASATDGDNIYEQVLYAEEVVASAGYSADLVALSPADGLALKLLLQEGGDHYAFAQAMPSVVISTAVDDGAGFVADTQAIGVLHLSPISFGTFEENAGASNSSTVRLEANGLFLPQRIGAAATLTSSS